LRAAALNQELVLERDAMVYVLLKPFLYSIDKVISVCNLKA